MDASTQFIHSRNQPMAVLDPNDIIGCTYLSTPEEDRTRMRLRVVEAIDEVDRNLNNSNAVIRFRAANKDGSYEEIQSMQQILDKIGEEDDSEQLWKLRSVDGHQGPLSQSEPDYKGSKFNLCISWANREVTWEPLTVMGKSDPVTVALYGRDNNLLELDGWKKFGCLARRQKKLLCLANQAKLKSFRTAPMYKFGVEIPRNHDHAMELDCQNGNTLWRDAELRKLGQLIDYETFKDYGRGKAPAGYKVIKYHIVYNVKHDLRRKARLVANGNMTPTPISSVYSSVVSLQGLRICLFLGKLNGLEAWSMDIGNAYLEAYTEEMVYIVAGKEFGDLCGHTLIIHKALYGLRSSGLRWWERLSVVLKEMGFVPSKAESYIWIRDCGNHYEYLA